MVFASSRSAYLWIKQNEHGRIMNRVLVKDADYTGLESIDCAWTRDSNGRRLPTEIKSMFDLRARQCDYIVKILNWRVLVQEYEQTLHRLYMEYLPLGDMYPFICSLDERDDVWYPEPFLWHVFECLAIAGLVMERGEVRENPMSDWVPIVHRDMKLSNTFLGLPDRNRFSRYPTPKIGDFGAAVYVPEPNDRPADYYNVAGTVENYGVEQNYRLTNWRVSSKSNVWGVANIVGSLIWKTEGCENLTYEQAHPEDPDEPEALKEPHFSDLQREKYSEELLNLIESCMAYDPDDRPDFSAVLRRTRRYMASRPDDGSDKLPPRLDRGLRFEPASSDKWADFLLDLEFTDKVRIEAVCLIDSI